MNRRDVLVGATATGAMLVSGCSSLPGGGDSGESNDGGREVAFGDHLVSFETADERPQSFRARSDNLEDYRAHDAAPLDDALDQLESIVVPSGTDLSVEDFDRFVDVTPVESAELAGYSVRTGEFDAADVTASIGRADEGESATHREFELFVGSSRSDDAPSYAVGDGVIVVTRGVSPMDGGLPRSSLERIVDAVTGNGAPVGDQYEPAGAVLDRIDPGLFTEVNVPRPEFTVTPQVQASAQTVDFDGQEATGHGTFRFESASAIDEAAFDDYVRSFEENSGAYDEVTYEVDGQFVDVISTGATADVFR